MPDPNDVDPTALPVDVTVDDAGDPESPPSSSQSQDTPVADDDTEQTRALRDERTRHGRELAEERRRAQQAEQATVALTQKVGQLEQYLGQMGQHLSQQEQARKAAYLANLPPEKRLEAQHAMLQQEVAALRKGQAAPPNGQRQYSQQELEEYTRSEAQKLLDEASDDFGLDSSEALSLDADGLDWESPEKFRKSARKLARTRALGGPVAKKTGTDDTTTRRGSPADIGGRSNAARPAATSRTSIDVSTEANRVFLNRNMSMKERQKALKANDEKVRQNLARASTR